MSKRSRKLLKAQKATIVTDYDVVLSGVVELLEAARHASARSVNAIMTATYWEIGRRIVELEQAGEERAEYGEALLIRLSGDLTRRFGRGFSRQNLQQMRLFYLAYLPHQICQTVSGKSQGTAILQNLSEKSWTSPAQLPAKSQTSSGKSEIRQTVSAEFGKPSPEIFQTVSGQLTLAEIAVRFPLPWSHYVRLLSVKKPEGRAFYEAEALRCGWSVRQLDRQVSTLFYERTLLSRNKKAMLQKGARPKPEEVLTPEEELKDPLVLEFLGLKDEYSESDLEEALIRHLESFLLELGGDFAFVGRQRRLRLGNKWYRVDLVFFHRKLRCLVVIDLKLGELTHADAGQMHLYLNFARENWANPGENPPVGLILCSERDEAIVQYALEGLPNKVMAAEYLTVLPNEKALAAQLERTRKMLEAHRAARVRGGAKR
jgi:predicted nuclease of restriction endonuclease-like (RecB) superfamily